MSKIVFDIETIGHPLESFDAVQQEYLMKFAQTPEEKEGAIRKLNLNPFTAQIIAIGMMNPDTNAGKVFYQSPTKESSTSPDGFIEYVSGTEVELLQNFWETVSIYHQFITFNGRSFDCPFLMLRSAMLEVKPTRNLMPYRYSSHEHCDLMEQLTFYGVIRKFNLDFYCKALAIKSPKSDGISGLDLGNLFREGRYKEIAEYCMGDVKATVELYHRWNKYLNFER